MKPSVNIKQENKKINSTTSAIEYEPKHFI